MGLQKTGGVAALIMAATFVFAIAVFAGVLLPSGYFDAGSEPARKAAILAENQAVVSLSYLVSFVLFGALLVVLALALHERMKAGAPAVAQTATAFGLIWAGLVIAAGMVATIGIARIVDLHASDPTQAGSLWVALDFVVNGLGGELEIVGGLWVLLVSWAALRAREFPRALNYVGLLIGAAGILTLIPAVEGIVFGLGLIVWFVWLGVVMLRGSRSVPARAR